MRKILRVGDPHITTRNLKDAENLIDFIIVQCKEYQVEQIEFMGDLFHTHAVIRMEVLDFWRRSLKKLTEECGIAPNKVIMLVGNHDMPGAKNLEGKMSALDVFHDMGFTVVSNPIVLDNIGYVPYTHDHEKFIQSCQELYNQGAVNMLVCHQTFQGAQYENGFYDPNGIELAKIPQKYIISGHIHKRQKVGKCFYIGTPKWDISSDANQDKGIWVFKHKPDGFIIDGVKDSGFTFISTENVVTPIVKHVVHEGEEVPELNPKARVFLEFVGKTSWITKMKKEYKGRASIKGKPVDRKADKFDRDQGLSLEDFLKGQFDPITGVSKEQIDNLLREYADV